VKRSTRSTAALATTLLLSLAGAGGGVAVQADRAARAEDSVAVQGEKVRVLEAEVERLRGTVADQRDVAHLREILGRVERKIDRLLSLPPPGPAEPPPPRPAPEDDDGGEDDGDAEEPCHEQLRRVDEKLDELIRRRSPP